MSATSKIRAWLRAAAAVFSALVLCAGCASNASPVEAVPELRTWLSAVDHAIADHKYGQARRQIQRLVRQTVSARQAGELDPDAAEPILAAAASLASALPRQQKVPEPPSPRPEPEPDADEQPSEPDEGTGNDEEAKEKRQEELQKEREELQKKLEEEEQKEEDEDDGEDGEGEEGGGNDDSSSNGPDDGHGN